jgi:Aldehyde dehydrogenase family
LDAAAAGIVRSAFGLSGQKCSACRQVVVVRDVADELAAKIVAKAEDLVIGDPTSKDTFMGPVIDENIAGRIDAAMRTATEDGHVLTGRRLDRDGNWFAPIVVSELPAGHALTREELFGPFLTITKVDNFSDALAEANDVPYGVTAGVFSAATRPRSTNLSNRSRLASYTSTAPLGYHRRLARRAVVLRLEAQRFSGQGRPGPLVHPGFHARAEPHHREEPFVTPIRQSSVIRRPRRWRGASW